MQTETASSSTAARFKLDLSRVWARLHVDRLVHSRSRLAVAGVATVAHGLLYGLANRYPLFEPVQLPLTPLDALTPLIPLTAWIYWSDYLLVFIAFRKTPAPVRFIRAFVLTVFAAVTLHLLFPTVYPREVFPLGAQAQTFSGALLVRFRELDQATSCFPSLHVAVATLAALSVRRTRYGLTLAVWAALIALSTLTTKQHYAWDVAGGALLGALCFALAARLGHHPEPEPEPRAATASAPLAR